MIQFKHLGMNGFASSADSACTVNSSGRCEWTMQQRQHPSNTQKSLKCPASQYSAFVSWHEGHTCNVSDLHRHLL